MNTMTPSLGAPTPSFVEEIPSSGIESARVAPVERRCAEPACAHAGALGREAALFVTLIFGAMVIYSSVAITTGRLTPGLRQGLDAMGFLFALLFAVASRRGRRFFGVTTDGAGRSLAEGVAFTLVLAPFAVVVRLALDRFGLMPPGTPLFSLSASKLTVLYFATTVPLEEFVYRGVVQTYVGELWGGGRARSIAPVVFAAGLFGFYHVASTPMLAILVIPPAVAWGILYQRSKSLLGVVVSHALVGWLAFDVLSLTKALLPGGA